MLRAIFAALILTTPLFAADPPFDRKQLKPGLFWSSENSKFVEGIGPRLIPFKTSLVPSVAILLNPTEASAPDARAPESFSWLGYLQIVTPGEYKFSANVQAYSANVTILNVEKKIGKNVLEIESSPEKTQLLSGDATKLEAGYYVFRAGVSFIKGRMLNDATKRSQFELLWEGPGFKREPIPWFFFSHLAQQNNEKHDIEQFATDNRLDHGRFLFEELSCIKCHHPGKEDANFAKSLVEHGAPDLSKVGERVFPGWVDAWLADPAKLRPQTTMPKLFDDSEGGIAERYAVVKYLTDVARPLKEAKTPAINDGGYRRSLESGSKLFTTAGCAACHGPKLAGTMKHNDDDDDTAPVFNPLNSFYGLGTATGPQARYALGGVGSKTTPDVLAKYLQDPLQQNPHGRMPSLNLSGDEARDLARHLMRFTEEAVTDRIKVTEPKWKPGQLAQRLLNDREAKTFEKMPPEAQWKALGQKLYVSKGCVNCHAMDVRDMKLAPNDSFPNLSAIRKGVDGGCLAASPKRIVYKLDAGQRAALAEFVKSTASGLGTPAPTYQARAALKRFNCLNCHSKDGEGGIGNELADAMKNLESAASVDDVQPPRLTGIGHKATTEWLKAVLVNGERARPWMGLRMPQFGEANVGFLATALPACEGIGPDTVGGKPKISRTLIEAGRKLAGKEGLGCVACHDISGYVGGGTRGPDLALTDRRVRQEWYSRWMHNPQRLAPGTRMPQNFTESKSVSPLLKGDADAQIEALWAYFSLGPGLPLPNGLEPPTKGMPLLVKDRPELLRTFMPDSAGTRPIAVGFPGGGSYAFDTHANRVVYAWEGNFLDVKPVWDGRGGNPAKLLGSKYYTPPPGQPWFVGDKPDFEKQSKDYAYGEPVPWQQYFSGPMRVHFGGYTLDTEGRPTFRYSVDDAKGEASVSVADTPLPVRASIAAGLQRSFAVDAGKVNGLPLWFQVANAAKNPRIVNAKGETVAFDARLGAAADGVILMLPQAGDRGIAVKLAAAPKGSTWQLLPSGIAALKIPARPGEPKYEVAFTVMALPRDDDSLLAALEWK